MEAKREGSGSAPVSPDSPGITGSEFTPIRIDTTGKPLDEGPREPLFYVDGPDGSREYTIPTRIPAAWSVQAVRIHRAQGADAARAWLLEQALTPEAIHELTEGEASKHVTRDQVRAIFTRLGDKFYGQAQEDTAGK